MRNTKLLTAAFVALSLTLGGCVSNLSGDRYSRDEARKVQTVRLGTIEMLRPVKIEGTKTPIGAGAGAVVGGIGGSTIGGGRGAAVAAGHVRREPDLRGADLAGAGHHARRRVRGRAPV